MEKFIHIRSHKFQALPGEEEEIVNEGMYGKALCKYLQKELLKYNYESPTYYCEDWGWMLEIHNLPKGLDVCVYCDPEKNPPTEYVICNSALSDKKWSWKNFSYIDLKPFIEKLNKDLVEIFAADSQVELVQVTEEMPF